MAKIHSGIFGGISGSVGGLVGANWKGVNTIRSKPVSVANPNTAGQQAQRGKFASVVSVARDLLGSLIVGYWDPFARRMSGYNAFVKENIDAFTTVGLDDPYSFFAARGSLLGVEPISVDAVNGNSYVHILWTDNTGQSDALGSDIIRVLIYNETTDRWMFSSTATVAREDEEDDFAIPTPLATADELHIYIFAARADGSKVSDSVYEPKTVTAP
jgi:hypothetical protein